MLNLYRKIDIPDLSSLQKKILAFLPSELYSRPRIYFPEDQSNFFKVEELVSLLQRYNMDPARTNFGFYGMSPLRTDPIHLDWGNTEYSMNIPLSGCDNTFTSFYSTSQEPELVPARTLEGIYHTPHYSFAGVECKQILEFESNVPVIMHIKTPHRVVNNTKGFRFNLLLRHQNNDVMREIFNQLA